MSPLRFGPSIMYAIASACCVTFGLSAQGTQRAFMIGCAVLFGLLAIISAIGIAASSDSPHEQRGGSHVDV